jgi:aminopeptidase N
MNAMQHAIGKDELAKGMQAYFSKWKFKHPYPEDLQASLESVTHISLVKIFNLLHSNELL